MMRSCTIVCVCVCHECFVWRNVSSFHVPQCSLKSTLLNLFLVFPFFLTTISPLPCFFVFFQGHQAGQHSLRCERPHPPGWLWLLSQTYGGWDGTILPQRCCYYPQSKANIPELYWPPCQPPEVSLEECGSVAWLFLLCMIQTILYAEEDISLRCYIKGRYQFEIVYQRGARVCSSNVNIVIWSYEALK